MNSTQGKKENHFRRDSTGIPGMSERLSDRSFEPHRDITLGNLWLGQYILLNFQIPLWMILGKITWTLKWKSQALVKHVKQEMCIFRTKLSNSEEVILMEPLLVHPPFPHYFSTTIWESLMTFPKFGSSADTSVYVRDTHSVWRLLCP